MTSFARNAVRVAIVLSGLLLLRAAPAAAQTDHSGNCMGTFSPAGNPHRLTGTCTVPAGETLTLPPGAVLESASGFRTLLVDGTLDADQATISSLSIQYRAGSDGTVQDSQIDGNVVVQGNQADNPATPTLEDNTIVSASTAVDIQQRAQPTISGNTLQGNSFSGTLRISGDAGGSVTGNTIRAQNDISNNRALIDLDGAPTTVITNNTLEDDPSRGDRAFDCTGMSPDAAFVFQNNQIDAGPGDGLVIGIGFFALTNTASISGNDLDQDLDVRIGSGTISDDSQIEPVNGVSAFTLDGTVFVNDATLTIPSGISIDGGRTIRLDNFARLEANGVTFAETLLQYFVGTGGTIEDCVFTGTSRFEVRGVSVTDPATPVITGSTIDAAVVNVFNVFENGNPTITNNDIRHGFRAFLFSGSARGTVSGNTISSAEAANTVAFDVDGAASPAIENNELVDNPNQRQIGIDLRNIDATSTAIVQNNTIRAGATDQPLIVGPNFLRLDASAVVQGNQFPDGVGEGAFLGSGTLAADAMLGSISGFDTYTLESTVSVNAGATLTIATGVTLDGANGRRLDLRGNLDAEGATLSRLFFDYDVGSGGTLQGNTISNSTFRARGTSADDPASPTITGNQISTGTSQLFSIENTAQPTITDNVITTGGTALRFSSSAGGTVTGNTFTFVSGVGFSRSAIDLDGAASPLISGNTFNDDPVQNDATFDLTNLEPASGVTISDNSICATGGDAPFIFGPGFFGVAMNATVQDNDLVCEDGVFRLASASVSSDAQIAPVEGRSTFTLDSTLTVSPGVILTIPEGVRIEGTNRFLSVAGTLNASGVELDGIFVDFQNGSAGLLEDSVFTGNARVRVSDSSPTISGNLFEGAQTAIELRGQTNVSITDNTFLDNTTAISVSETQSLSTVTSNVFDGNARAVTLSSAGALFSALPDLSDNDFLGGSDENVIALPFTIDTSGVLPAQPVAYFAQGMTVNAGSTVDVEPGVAIQSSDNTQIVVNGRLVAEGLLDLPIVFTAFQAKQGRRWRGLQFRDQAGGSASILEAVIVEFAGRGAQPGILLDNADVSITDSVVAENAFDGVRAQNGSSPTITGCAIANNQRHGVSVSADSSPVLNFNSLFGNATSGVTVDTCADPSALIDASDNFWGDDTGPFDNSDDTAGGGLFNPLGAGETVSDCVGYDPFTTLGPSIEGTIVLVSGQNQSGTAGEILPAPLVVEIRNLAAQPLSGIDVTFTVVAGDASIVEGQPITTGANGRAAATVQLGDTPGDVTIAVSAVDVNSPLAKFMAQGNGSALFNLTALAPPGWICPGDCDGLGEVSVDELLRGVNIALGKLPLSECRAMDRAADGSVGVDDLIEAVGMSIRGCP